MSTSIKTPDENPSNVESILSDTIGLPGYTINPPGSRIETLLIELNELIKSGGGGGGSDIYATNLSLTIDSSTYVVTAILKNQNGESIGAAQTIDLPLESVVVGGSYNSQTKKVVLTLQNGNTVEFSVADLVSGLQTELSESNKLNPAYINYDSTHRAVSDAEKSTWNGKQNALSSAQLTAVNSGIDSTKVAQIETNKNNILYCQKTGVKNIMDLSKYKELNLPIIVGDNLVFHGVTWTISNSYGLTVSGTADSSGSYPSIYSANLPIGTYYLTGGDSTIELLTSNNQHESGQGLTIEITESTTQPYVIRGYVPPNTAITGTHNIKPMLRQVGDSTFEPYAMSNAELTAKEQVNKNNISTANAELIELVDGGAKNILNLVAPTAINRMTIADAGNGSITASCSNATWANSGYEVGLTAGKSYKFLIYVDSANVADVQFQCFVNDVSSGASQELGRTSRITSTGIYSVDFVATTKIRVGINLNNSGTAATGSATYHAILCTQAAWDISQQYVPYRPSYQELYEEVETKATVYDIFGTTNRINFGDNLDDYLTPGAYVSPTDSISQSLTNCPVTVAFRLEILQVAAIDRYRQFIHPNGEGVFYIRNRLSGRWSAWYKFEGTAVT